LNFSNKSTTSNRLFNLIFLLLLVLSHTVARSGEGSTFERWGQLTTDNDAFAGEDDGYTGGIAYNWGYTGFSEFDSEALPAWIHYLTKDLYISTLPDRQRAVAYTIDARAYTPDDTNSKKVIEDDRPYAGLLLWSGDLYAFNSKVADRLGLKLGVVGQASGAEHLQDFVHSITGSDKSNGWDNQLDNEPVVRFEAERMWRLKEGSLGDVEFDTIGMAQAGIGNLRSDAGVGAAFRIGKNLSDTWATASPDPSKKAHALPGRQRTSWQVFLTVYGSYVANDITIDGNTFEDSHSVSLEHGQAIGALGFALGYDNWAMLFAYQVGTDQFKEQDYDTKFGTLSMAYRF
jgi:lipid A 3-O-deacylase